MELDQLINLLKEKTEVKKGYRNETNEKSYLESFLRSNLININPKYYGLLYHFFDDDYVTLTISKKSGGSILPIFCEEEDRIYKSIRINDGEKAYASLAHEVGHGVDYYINQQRNKMDTISSTEYNGASLSDVLKEEISRKSKTLIPKMLNDFRELLKIEFGYDILALYEECEPLLKRKAELHEALKPNEGTIGSHLMKEGNNQAILKEYMDVIETLKAKNATNIDNNVKGSKSGLGIIKMYTVPIVESLISFYNSEFYGLFEHKPSYFKKDETYALEFFAEFFAYVLTDDFASLNTIKLLLPKTYKKCKELFDFAILKY